MPNDMAPASGLQVGRGWGAWTSFEDGPVADGKGLGDAPKRATGEHRYGVQIKAIVIQEAGLDGFWIHRLPRANGIESRVDDVASIAVARRHRRHGLGQALAAVALV